jgi:hypothetical protein
MELTTIKSKLTEFDEQVKLIRGAIDGRRMMAILIDDEGRVEVVPPGNYPIINLFGALELAKLALFED